MNDAPYWKAERCAECGRGFSQESYDNHHDARDGLGCVHEGCCKAPECREARAIARKLARDLAAARALCKQYPEVPPPPPAQAGLWGRGAI